MRGGGREVVRDAMMAAFRSWAPDSVSMPTPSHAKMLNWRTSQVVESDSRGKNGRDVDGVAVMRRGLALGGDWASGESSFEGCVRSAEAIVEFCVEHLGSGNPPLSHHQEESSRRSGASGVASEKKKRNRKRRGKRRNGKKKKQPD